MIKEVNKGIAYTASIGTTVKGIRYPEKVSANKGAYALTPEITNPDSIGNTIASNTNK